jgi:hypothetical protein
MQEICLIAYWGCLAITVLKKIESAGTRYFISLDQFAKFSVIDWASIW